MMARRYSFLGRSCKRLTCVRDPLQCLLHGGATRLRLPSSYNQRFYCTSRRVLQMQNAALGEIEEEEEDDDGDDTTGNEYETDQSDTLSRSKPLRGALTREELECFKLPQLKDMCRSHRLRVGGNKLNLINRLLDYQKYCPTDPLLPLDDETVFPTAVGIISNESESQSDSEIDRGTESENELSILQDADTDDEHGSEARPNPTTHEMREAMLRAMEELATKQPAKDKKAKATTVKATAKREKEKARKKAKPLPVPAPVEYCFDRSENYRLVPSTSIRDPKNKVTAGLAVVANEADSLINILPKVLRDALEDGQKSQLMELVLDLGRRPSAWLIGPETQQKNASSADAALEPVEKASTGPGDSSLNKSSFDSSASSSDSFKRRIYIGDPTLKVTRDMLQDIAKHLRFGQDNRSGLDGSLHRISAVRNREGNIIGLTLRVGRHVPGNALMVADLLYRQPDVSVLFVGPPGTGKTSIIRDAARILAERVNVVIVDTSCEIGGAGDVPHGCIGRSRRMQVPSINRQAHVMIECVQNHTPQVMVIDEIGRFEEVKAALTCHERGVRILASAHGTMAGLVRNTELCDLLGGVETVTVGDKTAAKQAKGSFGEKAEGAKLRAERRGPPIFDVVIELGPGQLHEWRIVYPTGKAVDSILSTACYTGQVRRRALDNEGHLQIHSVQVNADTDRVLEEARLRATPFAQNKVSQQWNPDKDVFSCPVCRKPFERKADMLKHVLAKKACKCSLSSTERAALRKEQKGANQM